MIDLLEAIDIKKGYRSTEVLKGICLTVRPGEIVSMLGQNGAGKTTSIRIFSTLLQADSGSLRLFGEDPEFRRDEVIRRIGYVGQDTERSAYARLTVEENLLFFGRLMGLSKKVIKERIEHIATYFEFEDKLGEEFMKLSGGQKQTVIIMRSLLHNPDLIFLDEPTKGLDPVRAREIRSFLIRYVRHEGKSLLLTSHILPEVEQLADRVAFMKDGRIDFLDTPQAACDQLGYKDVIEIRACGRTDVFKQKMSGLGRARLLSEGEGGRLVYGTNDFLKAAELCRDCFSKGDNLEFLHRKVSLEDAYLHFTGKDLNFGGAENETEKAI